ncbi:GAF domain/GGDEF domain-containing protein [Sesbania bispinosa]|nr:GAF domain/GGDEF domain-containing protein [Sesbania bispinosa]
MLNAFLTFGNPGSKHHCHNRKRILNRNGYLKVRFEIGGKGEGAMYLASRNLASGKIIDRIRIGIIKVNNVDTFIIVKSSAEHLFGDPGPLASGLPTKVPSIKHATKLAAEQQHNGTYSDQTQN